MYAGYGAMMISRQMITILSPALLSDQSLGFNEKDTNDILAYGTKSSGWPGMTKIVGNWFRPEKYGTTWSVLSTSSRPTIPPMYRKK